MNVRRNINDFLNAFVIHHIAYDFSDLYNDRRRKGKPHYLLNLMGGKRREHEKAVQERHV